MTAAGICPVCDGQMPDRGRPHGGRKAPYCSGACKSKAYRARQAGDSAVPDGPPLPAAARHARAVEIRQQVSELAGILADAASGQQPLFATPGTARRTRPADTGRILHRLIAELTTLAVTATVTKRATLLRAPSGTPQAMPLFNEPGTIGRTAGAADRLSDGPPCAHQVSAHPAGDHAAPDEESSGKRGIEHCRRHPPARA